MTESASEHYVILGAGQAGAEVAASLRKKGFEGRITLVGEEPQPPYRRPPLSKAFLAGEAEEAREPVRVHGRGAGARGDEEVARLLLGRGRVVVALLTATSFAVTSTLPLAFVLAFPFPFVSGRGANGPTTGNSGGGLSLDATETLGMVMFARSHGGGKCP